MAINEQKINTINKEFEVLCKMFCGFCDEYARFLVIYGIISDIREKGRSLLFYEGKWSERCDEWNKWNIFDDYFVKEFIVGKFCTSCVMRVRAIAFMDAKDLTIYKILKDIEGLDLEDDSVMCEICKIVFEMKRIFHKDKDSECCKIEKIANKIIAHFEYSPKRKPVFLGKNDIKECYKRIHEILCRIYRLLLTNKLLREGYHSQAFLSGLPWPQYPDILEASDEYKNFRKEYEEWWKNSQRLLDCWENSQG